MSSSSLSLSVRKSSSISRASTIAKHAGELNLVEKWIMNHQTLMTIESGIQNVRLASWRVSDIHDLLLVTCSNIYVQAIQAFHSPNVIHLNLNECNICISLVYPFNYPKLYILPGHAFPLKSTIWFSESLDITRSLNCNPCKCRSSRPELRCVFFCWKVVR